MTFEEKCATLSFQPMSTVPGLVEAVEQVPVIRDGRFLRDESGSVVTEPMLERSWNIPIGLVLKKKKEHLIKGDLLYHLAGTIEWGSEYSAGYDTIEQSVDLLETFDGWAMLF